MPICKMTMKLIATLFLSVLFVMSCSKDTETPKTDTVKNTLTLSGTFIYTDSDCLDDKDDNDDDKSHTDCTDEIEFIDNTTRVSVILRKDDIVYETEYTTHDNTVLKFEKVPVSTIQLSFRIKNDTTLIRLEDNTTWIKE